MNQTSLRVAIVAPFPIRKYYSDYCVFTKKGTEHSASWIVNLVQALALIPDIELHLITIKSHLANDSHFFVDDVHFHVLQGTRNTVQPLTIYEFDRRTLISELHRIQPDIVESFGTEGPFSYAGVSSGYPCVIKIQGIVSRNLQEMGFRPQSYLWWRYYITQYIERATFRHCTDVIADNEFMASFALKENPDTRVHFIPNLITPLFFQIEQDWNQPRKNILFVGSLKPDKGIFDLLEAFRQVCVSGFQANLRIVGTGSANVIDKIHQIISEYGIQDCVTLLGQIDHRQISIEMQHAAFLVHPAWVDYSPNTVYEAMVAGLSVIATRTGGLPYMVDEGETGYLVEARIPTDLAKSMISLLDNSQKQQRMGNNAMQKMRMRFDESNILNNLLAVYHDMIARST